MISDDDIDEAMYDINEWWRSGNENYEEFQSLVYKFARAIYEQGRADQRVADIAKCLTFSKREDDMGAIIAAAVRDNTGDLT